MKRKFINNYRSAITALILFSSVVGCNNEGAIAPNESNNIATVTDAEFKHVETVGAFIEANSKQSLKDYYHIGFLHKIELRSFENPRIIILSASSKVSDFQSLNFILDENGQVETIFESFGYFDEFKNLVSHLHFAPNTVPDISYIDFIDGHREFLSENRVYSSARTNSWWGRFDRCVGSFNGPTSSNFGNLVFGVVANAATVGIYTPASLVLCGIAATASSDPPRTLVPSSSPNINDLRIKWTL